MKLNAIKCEDGLAMIQQLAKAKIKIVDYDGNRYQLEDYYGDRFWLWDVHAAKVLEWIFEQLDKAPENLQQAFSLNIALNESRQKKYILDAEGNYLILR